MSSHLTDDDVRAMLQARASAIPPGADREVVAAARAAIAGPVEKEGTSVSFPVRRVETVRRRSRTPWVAGAVAAAAIVAVAVLGSRVPLEHPRATTGPAGSPAETTGVAASSSSPGGFGAIDTGATTITIEQLARLLATGALDGKTVLVTSAASLGPGRCPYRASPDPAHDCIFMHLDGLPDVFISKGDRTAEQTQGEIERYGATTPMVLRGIDGGLQLLGWLVAGADRPLPPDGSALLRDGVHDDGLVAVEGWLQTEGVEQITTTKEPNAAAGLAVDIDPAARPAGGPTEGMFLLRPVLKTNRLSDIIRWQVVAQLSPSSTVSVDRTPRAASPTISAAEVMAALDDGSLDGRVLAIDGELKTVAADCPLDARPCERFYVDGLPGVAITWDGSTLGSDGSPGAPVSPTSGRLLVTPRRGPLDTRHGYLELLGILDGALDRPVQVGDLAAATVGGAVPDPMRAEPVNGWLLVDGPVYCPLLREGATPCPQQRSVLAATEPDPSGAAPPGSVPVQVRNGTRDIGRPPIDAPGPYLVRHTGGGNTCDDVVSGSASCATAPFEGWLVVARYDPKLVPVVTFP